MQQHTAIYVKDGHRSDGTVVDLIGAILDHVKTVETRNHNRLTRRPVGIVKDGLVFGEIVLGKPYTAGRGSDAHKAACIDGTEWDIPTGGTKWCYDITVTADYRDNPIPVAKHGNYAKYFI